MDTLLGLRPGNWHATDWAAAAVSGFAAGALLMVLDLIWSAMFAPHGPWRTSHMIAPIFLGADKLAVSAYPFSLLVVSIGLATHYALGILFGVAVAAVMAQLGLDGSPWRASGAGVVLGVLLYLLNFGIGPAIFPWLAGLRGADTLAAHVVFGLAAALLYWRLKRTVAET